jgi:hypothetical protein
LSFSPEVSFQLFVIVVPVNVDIAVDVVDVIVFGIIFNDVACAIVVDVDIVVVDVDIVVVVVERERALLLVI